MRTFEHLSSALRVTEMRFIPIAARRSTSSFTRASGASGVPSLRRKPPVPSPAEGTGRPQRAETGAAMCPNLVESLFCSLSVRGSFRCS